MVCYYSNFIEMIPLQRDTRSCTIIKHIKTNIARYGIMETLISDNGPQFVSADFTDFTSKYGINHITSSPTHQQSNGQAEKSSKAREKPDEEVQTVWRRFLFSAPRYQEYTTRRSGRIPHATFTW